MPNPTHLSCLGFRQAGSADNYDLGGIVWQGLGGEDLVRGEVVYFASDGEFKKSTTISLYKNALVGVVVGGVDSDMEAIFTADGGAAGGNADAILVMTYGICKVIAAGALATAGIALIASSGTAGRVTTATEGNQVIGILLEAAAGAASVSKAFINPYVWGTEEDAT